jgi:hypothetical protein
LSWSIAARVSRVRFSSSRLRRPSGPRDSHLPHPALEIFQEKRLLPAGGGGEQPAGRGRVEEGNRLRAAEVDSPEAGAVLGQEEHRGVGAPPGLLQRIEDQPRRIGGVDDVGHPGPQCAQRTEQLAPLAEEDVRTTWPRP